MTRFGIGIVATAVAVLAASSDLPSLCAQSADRARGPSFEAASITPNRSGDLRVTIQPLPGGRFTATNVPMRAVIRFAYRIQNFQVDGGPGWLSADRFDIVAKGADTASQDQLRFIGPLPGSNFQSGRATMAFRGLTMEAFARFLVPMFDRAVVDRTGLAGYFDGDFDPSTEFPPPPPPPGVADPFDRQSFPSIFTVLSEQLGLKLESTRGPVEVFVIDRVEKPSAD